MPRSTHTQLLTMKKQLFQSCYRGAMKWKEAAKILGLHPKSLSRLKSNYELLGDCVLVGRKPGPRGGTPDNRTPENIEQIVVQLAIENPSLGPLPLAEKLAEEKGVIRHSTTVWRILKRRKVRYTTTCKRWKKEPQLYCLDNPGQEVQLDGSYPYGRSRGIVCYDCIDDCSRFLGGRCYAGVESDELAIQFVDEVVARVPFRIIAFRVDNRYGKKFEAHCCSLGITVIRNDPYSPQQNGKIERSHGTSKREFFWKLPWNISLEELNYHFQLWLKYYNYHRKHGGYGMNRLTPAEKLAQTYLGLLGQADPQKVTGILQQYIFHF